MSVRTDHRIPRRTFLKLAAGAIGIAAGGHPPAGASTSSATLYNGIRLADPWPPRRSAFPRSPAAPPYLVDRPEVVPIDVGRQLFVDDFLIERTSLTRTFHAAEYVDRNPVIAPATPWEKRDEYAERTRTPSNPAAMPFSDGIFYDPQDRLFKMWYMGGYQQNTCYAVSHDGQAWDRPALDVVKGTNIVIPANRDSSTVWLDLFERDPSRRFKIAKWHDRYMELGASADGIHWRDMGRTGITGDRTTFFFNPFRHVWVYSVRGQISIGGPRVRRYWETPDLFANVGWREDDPVLWVAADDRDPRRADYNVAPEVYNLDCVAYESLLLGLFTIYRGERDAREKPNDVCVGFSRDGFHWDRPERRPFLSVSEHVGAWNWANVQSCGGCCLVVGDRLFFYVSGRRGVPGTTAPGICSTGLATLRRDGFASIGDAPPGPVRRIDPDVPPGTLITRPVRFTGRHLFVNADVGGELRVEVLDRDGRTVPGFSTRDCAPIRGDLTRARVTWSTAADLSRVAGQPVRFRFTIVRGQLYSFWVSPSTNGASRGYVAAGGPGFTSPIDE